MEIFIAMAIIFFSIQIIKVIKCIKNKENINLIVTIFSIVFLIFLFSTGIFGGTAYNNASLKYELYQDGHYYLKSHNQYTEVSYNLYIYMKVIEPIGIVSALASLGIEIYKNYKEKHKMNLINDKHSDS